MAGTKTSQARNELILKHYHIARRVAAEFAKRLHGGHSLEDLVNTGLLGLIDAVGAYDPRQGVSFAAYAEARVRTAIVDGLREHDWAVWAHLRLADQVKELQDKLRQRLGREPTEAELAAGMGMSAEEYQSLATVVWLPLAEGDDARPTGASVEALLSAAPNAEEQRIDREDRRQIQAAISSLPERQRLVVTLSYTQGMTLARIGELLGVSESRVSQIRKQALTRLKKLVRGQGS